MVLSTRHRICSVIDKNMWYYARAYGKTLNTIVIIWNQYAILGWEIFYALADGWQGIHNINTLTLWWHLLKEEFSVEKYPNQMSIVQHIWRMSYYSASMHIYSLMHCTKIDECCLFQSNGFNFCNTFSTRLELKFNYKYYIIWLNENWS